MCTRSGYLSRFWFFFFKQKTAYEMRISDWSSDVCSSDLVLIGAIDMQMRLRLDKRKNGLAIRIINAGRHEREQHGEAPVEVILLCGQRLGVFDRGGMLIRPARLLAGGPFIRRPLKDLVDLLVLMTAQDSYFNGSIGESSGRER